MFLVATLGCQTEASLPPGASSRPAYPPKKMANVHDVVAYVDEGTAMAGIRQFQTVHDGGLYYFASQTHLDAFKANPGRYVPAFNGWCSCGMAKGMRLPASGKDFRIVDGQLYLFHDAEVATEWERDVPAMIAKAQRNWIDLK